MINLRTKKGFTIIEVMVGIVILLVAILASLSGFLGSVALNNASHNMTIAVNDAQYVLEQLRALNYSTCIQTNFSGGCYTLPVFNNLPGETVDFYPTPAIGATVSTITVRVRWQDNQQTRSFSLATKIAA
jgi:prepilin-type N-terminal cleavage/methylation domain-containing protein